MVPDLILADELPTSIPSSCKDCGALLCLRKQVVNLALGNLDTMHCLNCLAGQNGKSAGQLLEQITPYIFSRDCFAKQWRKNKDAAAGGWCVDICCSDNESKQKA